MLVEALGAGIINYQCSGSHVNNNYQNSYITNLLWLTPALHVDWGEDYFEFTFHANFTIVSDEAKWSCVPHCLLHGVDQWRVQCSPGGRLMSWWRLNTWLLCSEATKLKKKLTIEINLIISHFSWRGWGWGSRSSVVPQYDFGGKRRWSWMINNIVMQHAYLKILNL